MDFGLSEEQQARAPVSLITIYGRAGVILGPLTANFGSKAHRRREPFNRGEFLRKS